MTLPAPKIDEVYWEALQRSSDQERDAYLDRVCADSPEIRRDVEKLLRAKSNAEQFLEQAAVARPGDTVDDPITERPGAVIGHYKLLEQIGEGGFGVVFMAEQTEPVKRKVALKILKPGMDTKHVVARFEAERQALAMMDHPNIAQVYDGGATENGRPYFVMELVKGTPITSYCDKKQLDTGERLQLFLQVCQAVQHAHQKGVIHRDIKPSNVIVSSHDGDPVVKVIDFGIAKAMSGQLTDMTLFTGFAQMIGTPLYMSPEQAGMSDLDVDTRSDVYSLGVLLYELLTGVTPYDEAVMKKAGFDEIRRIIREQDPPKPSTRISTLGKLGTTLSESRKTDPQQLSRSLRGELDWIVMKALEKDRKRRYDTVSTFAADVQRYLDDKPVEARPASMSYRFRKFVRRNRKTVVAASLVGLTLIVGIFATSVGMMRALDAEHKAKLDRDAKDKALDAEEEARRVADQRRKLAYSALDKIYLRLVEEELPRHPDRLESYRHVLGEALTFYEALTKESGQDSTSNEELANAYVRAGRISSLLGQDSTAVKYYQRARVTFQSLHNKQPDNIVYISNLAGVLTLLGKQHLKLGHLNEAEQVLDELSRAWSTVPRGKELHTANRAESLRFEATLLRKIGRLDKASEAYEQAVIMLEQASKKDINTAYTLALCLMEWGNILSDEEKLKAADQAYLRALDQIEKLLDRSPDSTQFRSSHATTLLNYSACLFRQHRPAEAGKKINTGIKIAEELVAEYPLVPEYRSLLVNLYVNHSGTNSDIELTHDSKFFNTSLRLAEKNIQGAPNIPEYRQDYVQLCNNYASFLSSMGRLTDAEQILTNAEKHARLLFEEHDRVPEYRRKFATLLRNRAWLRMQLSKIDFAAKDASEALAQAKELCDSFPKSIAFQVALADAHQTYGNCLRKGGRPKDALIQHDAALAILNSLKDRKLLSDTGRFELATAYLNHGNIRFDLKDYPGALDSFQQGEDELLDLFRKAPNVAKFHARHARFYINRGDVLKNMKDFDAAENAYRQGVAIMDKLITKKSANPEPDHTFRLLKYTERLFQFVLEHRPNRLSALEPTLSRGIEVGENLVRGYPQMISYKEYLAVLHNSLAKINVASKRMAKAEPHLVRLAELADELYKLEPGKYRDMQEKAWNNVAVVASATENEVLLLKASERLVALKPGHAGEMNDFAWHLATCRDARLRNPERAIKLANQAVDIVEKTINDKAKLANYYGTLGAAYYRNRQFPQAVAALNKALQNRSADDAPSCFGRMYLAMSYWKQGEQQKALEQYKLAVNAMDSLTKNEERHRAHLDRLRTETAEILGLKQEKKS